MKCNNIICVALLLFILQAKAQNAAPASSDTSKVNAMLHEIKAAISQDPARGLKMATETKTVAEKLNYPVGVAIASKLMGNATYLLGQPENALLIWQEALTIFEKANDKIGQSELLSNIGIFYYHRGDEVKALDHHLRSLKIAESLNHKPGIASSLNNIGAVYYLKEATYDKALKYYLLALPLCEELHDQAKIGTISVNMGNIYMKRNEDKKAFEAFSKSLKAYASNPIQLPNVYISLGDLYLQLKDYPAAFRNYQLALDVAKKTNNQFNIARALNGKADVFSKKGDYSEAIGYFKEAEKIALAINSVWEFKGLYEGLATTYAKMGDYNNAYKYHVSFSNIKDTLYNIETDKKLATIQFDFDLEKKQNEINLLTKDKSIKELQLKKQETFKNALVIVLGLIVMVVFVLYRSYRIKAKSNVMLDRKNMEIERLLLNILPLEVAHELQTTGKATPRNYEQVSVMFTDFKGFTTLADKMTPQELVTELGNCFMAFDRIIEKHGLEKIKTIGDSYMCAGGIPTPSEDHIFRMIKASLEVKEYIQQANLKRKESGFTPWDIRIGIHVGPVVAGVVGNKKYAYDIWGTTVNIASRMESSGMPGHVNISSAVYEIIKNGYACVYRGKVYAKNVGEIDMYLVDHELTSPVAFRSLEEVQRKEEPARPVPANLLQ